jgi:hypothetical protein
MSSLADTGVKQYISPLSETLFAVADKFLLT